MARRYQRCDVAWGPARYKSSDGDSSSTPQDAPYLVINNNQHPFHEEDCIVLRLSRQRRSEAYHITSGDWEEGYPGEDGYVRAWNPMYFQEIMLRDKLGRLKEPVVDDIAISMMEYLLSQEAVLGCG